MDSKHRHQAGAWIPQHSTRSQPRTGAKFAEWWERPDWTSFNVAQNLWTLALFLALIFHGGMERDGTSETQPLSIFTQINLTTSPHPRGSPKMLYLTTAQEPPLPLGSKRSSTKTMCSLHEWANKLHSRIFYPSAPLDIFYHTVYPSNFKM